MNLDCFCEFEQAPRCTHGNDFIKKFSIKDLVTGLFLQGQGSGCHHCDKGFVSFMSNPKFFCTQSIYLKSELPTPTNYIPGCINYSHDEIGRLVCMKCKENEAVTIHGKCVLINNNPNCELAISDSLCKECLEGFILVIQKL